MQQTSYLNPLPSTEARDGSRIFREARPRHRRIIAVIIVCVFAVVSRVVLINQPYVDHWSWRQSDVAAIARNFLQNGSRFAYPQIDWAGSAPGYVGTEFPILPFIAALCYKFAGAYEWIGRIQAVIFFALSLPFFFLLVREIFVRTAAVLGDIFLQFCATKHFRRPFIHAGCPVAEPRDYRI